VAGDANDDAPENVDGEDDEPAIASPRTNFEAPSIEPKKSLSSSAPACALAQPSRR
jgi:hypothetical protein